jgi:hypothetical protein
LRPRLVGSYAPAVHHRPIGWLAGAAALAALVLAGSGCFESSSASPQTLDELLANNNVPQHHRSLYFTVNHRKLPLSAFRDLGISTRPRTLFVSAADARSVIVCAGGRPGTTVADSLQCGKGPPFRRYTVPAGVHVYRLRPLPGSPRTTGSDAHPVPVTPDSTVLYFADPTIRVELELGGAGFGYGMDDRVLG